MKPFIKTSAKDWRILVLMFDIGIAAIVLINLGIVGSSYLHQGTFDFEWLWFGIPLLLVSRVLAAREMKKRVALADVQGA